MKVNIWKPNLEPITRVKNLFLCISYKSRKHLIRYGVLQSLTVFLDLIGIAAIGVVGSMTVSGITSSQLNPNVANFLDWIGIKSFSLTYQVSVIAMIGGLLLISRSILSYTLSLRIYKLLASDSANLSSHLIKKIFNKDIANIGEYTKQEIVFILTSGTNKAVLDVVGSAILMIADFFTLILILLVLFIVDTPSAILTLAIFGVLSVVLFRNLKDRAGRLGKLNGDLFVEVNNSIIEGLDNIRVIKTSNFTKHVLANFDAVRLKQAKIQSELSIIPYISKYYFEVVLVFGAILVSAFQFIVYDSAHAITALTIFLASASRVVPATLRLQQNALAIRASIAYTEPVLLLLTEEAIGKEEIPVIDHVQFRGEVDVRHAKFRYPKALNLSLDNINLSLKENTFTAIIGRSGSGKSTLIDLILGLNKPESGEVRISGINPKDAIKTWPGKIAYVPQKTTLNDGTIAQNIAYGHSEQNESRIWEAIVSARLEEQILQMPQGIHTQVGEIGSRLSAGQQQRIGTARALYSNPKLLLLDEPTSALDATTENEFVKFLESIKSKVTLIVIAHRLMTVQNADKVIYLSNGKILAQGSLADVNQELLRINIDSGLSEILD